MLTAPCSMSSLDNGGPAMSFQSEFLAAALALDPPQREQQVDLFIGERLALDLCEDGLKVGSDALARVGFRDGDAPPRDPDLPWGPIGFPVGTPPHAKWAENQPRDVRSGSAIMVNGSSTALSASGMQ